MLSEDQITDVWERKLAAEVRFLYFAELASKYSQKKQWITFTTLFLSSGAAGSLLARSPIWVPTTLSVLVAVITAYTIAINLDLTIRSMSKLQTSWSELMESYQMLWDNVHSGDAQITLGSLTKRERALAELAATDAPNNQKRLAYWQDYVHRQHRLVTA